MLQNLVLASIFFSERRNLIVYSAHLQALLTFGLIFLESQATHKFYWSWNGLTNNLIFHFLWRDVCYVRWGPNFKRSIVCTEGLNFSSFGVKQPATNFNRFLFLLAHRFARELCLKTRKANAARNSDSFVCEDLTWHNAPVQPPLKVYFCAIRVVLGQ